MSDVLLDDEISKELHLVPASNGQRLANLVLDRIVIMLLAFLYGIALFYFDPAADLDYEERELGWLKDQLLGALLVLIYYPLTEGLLKGKSLGKFITGTRAVDYHGEPTDIGKSFMRALCRIVPFEAFSFLGQPNHGWHDKWTDTMVIDEKQSTY